MCEQSVEAEQPRMVCVCVDVCVWRLGPLCVCEGGGVVAIPAL